MKASHVLYSHLVKGGRKEGECACICVCVREREREKEGGKMKRVIGRLHNNDDRLLCICIAKKNGKEREIVREREREREIEREREREREIEREMGGGGGRRYVNRLKENNLQSQIK